MIIQILHVNPYICANASYVLLYICSYHLESNFCELLSDMILNKDSLDDIKKLSPSQQTSSLESYHI